MDADLFLIHRMRNGDEAAIESFVRKYYPAIFRYCYYHTAHRFQAEDLAQETFYRFFRLFSSYSHKDKLVNYLYVIAGNLCRDYWREKKRDMVELQDEIFPLPENTEIERKVDLERAVLSLPIEIQRVIYLHYFLEMKLKEIADAEQISLPLVKYRLKRGKELLEKKLRKEE